MPDLVGDHVAAREVSGSAETALQLLEERLVQVDLATARAVEGPDCRAGEPARRVHAPPEEYEPGRLVLPPHLLEELPPGVFGVSNDARDELLALVADSRRARSPRRARRGRGRHTAVTREHAQDLRGFLAEQQAVRDPRDQPQASELNAAAPEPEAAGGLALPILDVVALAHVAPAHGRLLSFVDAAEFWLRRTCRARHAPEPVRAPSLDAEETGTTGPTS